jgi:endopolyphosphatase
VFQLIVADLRYGDLALRYQDTIVGHLFGHMSALSCRLVDSQADRSHRNVDHFFFIDVDELEATSNLLPNSALSNTSQTDHPSSFVGPQLQGPHLHGSGRYKIKGRSSNNGLQGELWKDFGDMPGPGKIKLKDYAVMNVAPSVIPTYFPGIRVFS